MKKNTIKVVLMVCFILFSLACVDHFTCVDAYCKDSVRGYWDPSGQYHAFPPEEQHTPEEELALKIENAHLAGWSEQDIQELIPIWRKKLGLDSSASSTGSAGTSSTQAPAKATPSYTKEQVEAAWEETGRVEATCGADGSVSYKNSLTGKTKTEKIPATGLHTFEVTEHVDATCIADGHETRTCSVCGETQTEVIPSTGTEHAYELTEKVEATCTEEGREVYVCSLCGDTYTTPIPATGHKEGAPVVTKKAGWFSEGELTIYCETCGAVMSTEVIPQTCPLAIWQIIVIAVGIVVITLAVIMIAMKNRAKVCLQ